MLLQEDGIPLCLILIVYINTTPTDKEKKDGDAVDSKYTTTDSNPSITIRKVIGYCPSPTRGIPLSLLIYIYRTDRVDTHAQARI